MNLQENIYNYHNLSARDVFRAQDKLSVRIVFLVDQGVLSGVLSDGDIRRLIIDGGNLDGPAIDVANKNPVTAKNNTEAIQIMSKKPNLKAIPIVDENNVILDIYSLERPVVNALRLHVVINAGGKGTRLDPYTRILPKALIPIGNIPIIELIMREYEKYHSEEFYIIINYKGQMIKAYFSDDTRNYNIKWIHEEQPLGTGGGLSLLKEKMKDTFVFTNCDTLIQTDYSCVLEQHRREKNMVTVVCAYKNLRIPYGVVETEKNGVITKMKEKPEVSFLTNTGMYLVEPEVLDEMKTGEKVDFPDVLTRLMNKGAKVGVYPISEIEWMDMGQLDELERMREMMLKKG